MAIPEPYDDDQTIGTPAWWLKRLGEALAAREKALQRYEAYYSGRHRLAFATSKFRQQFGNLFSAFADNWCDLVVDAVEERLNVEGFRVPTSPTDVQEGSNAGVEADRDAWGIWQRNELDLFSQIAHSEALINGECYGLVWSNPSGDDAQITIEHPLQMITDADPENPLSVRAAMKRWTDDSGFVFATLYLPEALFKFVSDKKVYTRPGGGTALAQNATWVPRDVAGEEWPLPNPIGEVPVVPLRTRPRLMKASVSEIDQVIPAQDAVNKLFADMLIASEFQSFRQRWVAGLEMPTDPQTGEPIFEETYKQLLEKVWLFEGENVKVGELGQVDLHQYVDAIQMGVQHIASRTRTPPHYFYLSGQFPSGESIKSAETGLVAKTRRRMRSFGEGWESVIRLAFLVRKDTKRAEAAKLSEAIWGDPESRSEAQHIDAVVKLQTIGVPQEALWEEAGFTPQQIERFKVMRAAEASLARAQSGAAGGGNAQVGHTPTVFDPVTQQMVEIKDPNLRHEAPPGQIETPRPVGGTPAPPAGAP